MAPDSKGDMITMNDRIAILRMGVRPRFLVSTTRIRYPHNTLQPCATITSRLAAVHRTARFLRTTAKREALTRLEAAAMVRTRPTIVLVMAILTIVFGSIWTLISLCSGVGVLLICTIQAPQVEAALKPMREIYELLQKEVP